MHNSIPHKVSSASAFAACLAFIFLSGMLSARAQFRSDTSRVRTVTDSIFRQDSILHYEEQAFMRHDYLQRAIIAGATVGVPGGLNVAVGGYYDHAGIILEGGAFPVIFITIVGYQAELCYVLLRQSESLIQTSVTYSHSETSSADGPPEWDVTNRLGINIALNAGGFFFEYGIAHTFGNSGLVNSQVGQIGYMH